MEINKLTEQKKQFDFLKGLGVSDENAEYFANNYDLGNDIMNVDMGNVNVSDEAYSAHPSFLDVSKSIHRRTHTDLDTPENSETKENSVDYLKSLGLSDENAEYFANNYNLGNEQTTTPPQQDSTTQWETSYNSMFGDENVNYDTEYDQTLENDKKNSTITPIGRLSQKWQEAGGAIKFDNKGRSVLDIEKQNELAKDNPDIPDAISLLKYINKTGDILREKANEFYETGNKVAPTSFKFKKTDDNDFTVINTALLSPGERAELKKNQQELLDNGIIGQDIAKAKLEGEKLDTTNPRNTLQSIIHFAKYVGQGAVGVFDFIKDALIISGASVASQEFKRAHPNMGQEEQEILEAIENSDKTLPNFTQKYNKVTGISTPETANERIANFIGAMAVPLPGGASEKLLKKAGEIVIGALGSETGKQVMDWFQLSDEQKAKEVQKNRPLTNILIDLASLSLGARGVSKLEQLGLKKTGQGLTEEQIKQAKAIMNDKKVNEDAMKDVQKLQAEALSEQIQAIDKQITDPALFPWQEGKGTINSKAIKDLEKDLPILQAISKKINKDLIEEKIKDLPSKDINVNELKDKIGNLTFTDTETQTAKSNIGLKYDQLYKYQDLRQLATEDKVKPLDEVIKGKKEIRGANFQNKVNNLTEIPNFELADIEQVLDSKGLLQTEDPKSLFNSLSDDQKRLCVRFTSKLQEAQNQAELRNVIQELNKERKTRRNNGSDIHILNEIRDAYDQLIEQEISRGSEYAEQLKNLKQALSEYGEASKEIHALEEISEKYKGNKEHFVSAENRDANIGTDILENWRNLTIPQKNEFIKYSPKEVRDAFHQIELADLSPDKLISQNDSLAIKNAFGDEAETVLKQLETINIRQGKISRADVLTQSIEKFKKDEISEQKLHDIFQAVAPSIDFSSVLENAQIQKNILPKATINQGIKEGDAVALANKINTVNDIDNFDTLINAWSSKFPNANLSSFANSVKDQIWDTHFAQPIKNTAQKLQNIIQNANQSLSPQKVKDTISKAYEEYTATKDVLLHLNKDNKNIAQHLQEIDNFFLNANKLIEETEDMVKQVIEGNKPLSQYRKEVAKLTPTPKSGILGSAGRVIRWELLKDIFFKENSSFFTSLITSPKNITAGCGLLALVGIKQLLLKGIRNRKLTKLQNDPKYVYKLFLETKNNVQTLQNYVHDIIQLNKKYSPQILSEEGK